MVTRLTTYLGYVSVTSLALILLVASAVGKSETATAEAGTLLPDKIESFRATERADDRIINGIFKTLLAEPIVVVSQAARDYRNDAGSRFWIELIQTKNDSAAYSALTELASGTQGVSFGVVGIASVVYPARILFCKGANVVQIEWIDSPPNSRNELLSIAQSYAATLPADDDIPVLLRHLPNWEALANRALYSIPLARLSKFTRYQAVLDMLNFHVGP